MFGNVIRRLPVHWGPGAACLSNPSPSATSPRLRASPCTSTAVTAVRAAAAARHVRATHTDPSYLLCGTLSMAHRWSSTYPTASRRSVRTRTKKQFNYLTADRLIPTEKKLSRIAIRNRDDVSLRRRREYKQQLMRDVEEKIRFYPPSIKKQVFFPIMTNSTRVSLFRGNREYGIRTSTRVFSMLLEQLCKREHREFILEKLAELGLEPPTAEDWEHFTDPVTGDITTGMMYSKWVDSILTTYGRMSFTSSKHLLAAGATTLFAYVIRNYLDRTLVPPLEDWSRQFGPVVAEEFVGRPRGQQKVSLALSDALYEVRVWGRTHAQEAVSRLSLQEQTDLVKWVEGNMKTHIAEMERKHAFTAKILAVMHSLPEAKAIHNSFWAFKESKRLEHVVKMNGAFFPLHHDVHRQWSQLSKEEKARYSCFGRKRETETACGRKLFIRYCCRDYGFSLSDASQRYASLGDLQKAALEFPFYFPLTPGNAATAAFQRFYLVMCERYGMVRTYSSGIGNRLFKIAMRQKWDALSMEERQQYEEHDRIYAAFPLQPPTPEAAASGSAKASSSGSLPASTAPSAATRSSECVTTRWGTPAKGSTASRSQVRVGPQYFVEERPPSLKVDDTALTAEELLMNLREAAYGTHSNETKAKVAATAAHPKATSSVAETAAATADEKLQSRQQKEAADTQDVEVPMAASRRGRARSKTPGSTHGEGSTRTRQPALQVVMI
ncbi:hypothetical protein conserved [Leishmania donovani]|uniref:Hypothetical_protein_conserved n=1 Tax=Leishmania donovani TaxID=5661 RepID=A0A6J8FFT2_LEIDO|nr:hypothetical protein conserved [Leishmania donovani]VDZ46113.1 hypothetical_protein_conserved [Leishmania donovani]